MSRLVLSMTGSRLGAVASAALIVVNPNLLYVHVTPMTEPLLLAATLVSVLLLREWLLDLVRRPRAVLTRMGALPDGVDAVRGVADPRRGLAAAAFVLWRQGRPLQPARAPDVASSRNGRPPLSALFLVLSRLTVGAWFVSGGFYERDPTYDAQAGQDHCWPSGGARIVSAAT